MKTSLQDGASFFYCRRFPNINFVGAEVNREAFFHMPSLSEVYQVAIGERAFSVVASRLWNGFSREVCLDTPLLLFDALARLFILFQKAFNC